MYKPKASETKAAYEQIVHIVQKHLGDFSIETIKDAADDVLACLKNDNFNDKQRKSKIDDILGLSKLSEDEFNTLTVLSQLLTDYEAEEIQDNLPQDQQDIAIDLDDDEAESEDLEYDQVKEVDEESEHNEEMEETQDEQIVEQPKSNQLSINDIDAHWIKRKLEESIEDKDIITYE